MRQPLNLFLSYARKDFEFRDELLDFLKLLEKQNIIRLWYDQLTTPGSEWRPEVQKALDEAKVIIALVSIKYCTSDICMKVELARAIEKQAAKEAILIPILVEATPIAQVPPLCDLQIIPDDLIPVDAQPNRARAWSNLTDRIVSEIKRFEETHAPLWSRAARPARVSFASEQAPVHLRKLRRARPLARLRHRPDPGPTRRKRHALQDSVR